MISDVLSEAHSELERYLREFPQVYNGELADKATRLMAQMEELRLELDTPPTPDEIREHAHYAEIARAAAKYAHSAYVQWRRGTFPGESGSVVIYDNSPYAEFPQRRNRELTAMVSALAEQGVELAARAAAGDDGYTVAMVFTANPGRVAPDDLEATIVREWTRALGSSLAVESSKGQ